MAFVQKAKIMDKEAIHKVLVRISHEILEKCRDTSDLVIIGIRNRGELLAKRIAGELKKIANIDVPLGILDITLYRDDLTQVAEQPVVKETVINLDINEKRIILVDDVLFTGRTIRCALSELVDFGRPKNIQLAVLIDRGHRELPIRADYVGKNVPTALNEVVEVKLEETDGVDEVLLCQKR
ncbi:MAG: bifunctional pyr operon transcriptional regulator/uracil phosphoribosyltransferase PyrR [Candidatus Omnitrophica bacterium]|nr:bifunctional pyr operon transcriptional regulator/uracil phosphoribosyltransferase PyrR [Candidatus Omnitrophota bacterium]